MARQGSFPPIEQSIHYMSITFMLAQFWLGQILTGPILLDRYYGRAILVGLMAGSLIGPVKEWPSQSEKKFGPAIIGTAKFFFTLAGSFFDWAKIGCGWPSQTFFHNI